MKNLLLLFLFFFSVNSFSQSYHLVYQRYLQPPPLPTHSGETGNSVKRKPKKIKANFYHLIITKNKSVSFRSQKKDIDLSKLSDNFKGLVYYQDIPKKETVITDYTMLTNFFTKYSLTIDDYNIDSNMILLNGYKAFKASNTNINIFFTPELPITQGPKYYGGFPGLILKIELPNTTLDLIDVQTINLEKIPEPNLENLNYLTGNEFMQKRKDAYMGTIVVNK